MVTSWFGLVDIEFLFPAIKADTLPKVASTVIELKAGFLKQFANDFNRHA
jgi:hypothetical protein